MEHQPTVSAPAPATPPASGAVAPSLRVAVPVVLLLVGLSAVAAQALFFLEYSSREARGGQVGKCRRQGSGLARQATRLLDTGKRHIFKDDLSRLAREDGVVLTLLCDANGIINVGRGNLIKQSYRELLAPEKVKLVDECFHDGRAKVIALEDHSAVIGVFPVVLKDNLAHIVYHELDLVEPWSRARQEALVESAVSAGMLVVASALLWAWLNRSVTRRVKLIVEGAQDLAMGREPPPPLTGVDELATIDQAMRAAHATVAGQALEVRLQKERYRLMMEALPVGVITLRQGQVDYVNRAGLKLLKLVASDTLDAPSTDPSPPRALLEKVEAMLAGGQTEPQDLMIKRADGSGYLALELIAYQYDDFSGPAAKVVLHDVTERRAAEAKRSALSHEIARTSEQEQRRIGQDLHDDICQRLAALKMNLQDFEEELAEKAPMLMDQADAMVGRLSEAIQVTRALARGLSPVDIEAGGLAVALAGLVRDAHQLSGVECLLELAEPLPPLPQHTATQLYRITQESINNAVRHAAATRVEIKVHEPRPGTLELRVANNGEPWRFRRHSDGMGLAIMRYRAESIRAELDFDLTPADATTAMRCTVPLSGEDASSV